MSCETVLQLIFQLQQFLHHAAIFSHLMGQLFVQGVNLFIFLHILGDRMIDHIGQFAQLVDQLVNILAAMNLRSCCRCSKDSTAPRTGLRTAAPPSRAPSPAYAGRRRPHC